LFPGAAGLKLVLIIAGAADGDRLITSLISRGLSATKIASQGGFLRRGSVTILSGVEDHEVDGVLALTRKECRSRIEVLPTTGLPVFEELPLATAKQPLEVRVGGATVFVLPVDRFERF
jgi:uncharacterized protein YaaQ